jgi:hypothetical protein
MRSRVRAENRTARAEKRAERAEWKIACAEARAKGDKRPDKPAKANQKGDEWPHPDDWPGSHPEGQAAYNAARDEVEVRMREALATGALVPVYLDHKGVFRHCIDRRSWREYRSPTGLGLDDEIQYPTCPGPPELEGCFALLDEGRFKGWLEKEAAANRTRPVSQHGLEAAYLERVKRIGASVQSSLQDDLEAMRKQLPQAQIARHQVASLRSKHAPKEWKAPGSRKR